MPPAASWLRLAATRLRSRSSCSRSSRSSARSWRPSRASWWLGPQPDGPGRWPHSSQSWDASPEPSSTSGRRPRWSGATPSRPWPGSWPSSVVTVRCSWCSTTCSSPRRRRLIWSTSCSDGTGRLGSWWRRRRPTIDDLVGRLGISAVALRVGPLTASAVAELARAAGHPELAEDLVRRTKGHTLFVLESLRSLGDARGPGGAREPPLGRPSPRRPLRVRCRGVPARCRGGGRGLRRRAGRRAPAAPRRRGGSPRRDRPSGTHPRGVRSALRVRQRRDPPSAVRHHTGTDAGAPPPPPRAAARGHAGSGRRARRARRRVGAGRRPVAHGGQRGRLVPSPSRRPTRCSPVRSTPAPRSATRSACSRVYLLRGRARLAHARYDDAREDLTVAQALARANGDLEIEASSIEELGWCAYHARELDRWADLAERAARHPAAGSASRVLLGRLRNAKGDLAGAIEILEPVASLERRGRRGSGIELPRHGARAERSARGGGGGARTRRRDVSGSRSAPTDVQRHLLLRHRPRQPGRSRCRAWTSPCRSRSTSTGSTTMPIGPGRTTSSRGCGASSATPAAPSTTRQQALETSRLRDGHVEAEPAAHARLQLAESALMLGDEAEAGRWLAELREHETDSVAFGWRIDLHRLDVQARMDPVGRGGAPRPVDRAWLGEVPLAGAGSPRSAGRGLHASRRRPAPTCSSLTSHRLRPRRPQPTGSRVAFHPSCGTTSCDVARAEPEPSGR